LLLRIIITSLIKMQVILNAERKTNRVYDKKQV
jgi:hypothetical protein